MGVFNNLTQQPKLIKDQQILDSLKSLYDKFDTIDTLITSIPSSLDALDVESSDDKIAKYYRDTKSALQTRFTSLKDAKDESEGDRKKNELEATQLIKELEEFKILASQDVTEFIDNVRKFFTKLEEDDKSINQFIGVVLAEKKKETDYQTTQSQSTQSDIDELIKKSTEF
jgi:hypothetical protein